MNKRMEDLMYHSGLTAQGCWDEMDDYDKQAIEKFAELIVRECIKELETSRKCDPYTGNLFDCEYNICLNEQTIMLKEHFGVKK
jgi:hypothetical protein